MSKGGKILESLMNYLIFMRAHRLKRDYKSLAYKLTFRAKDRTLEEADISCCHERIDNERSGASGDRAAPVESWCLY
ncbi:MAG: hypothetical protein ACLUN0_04085 [Roseburia sp.]